MGDGSVSSSIMEIFEITIAVIVLLLIGSAIMIIPNVDSTKNKAIATEISYAKALISDSKITVKTKYPETKIELISNSIQVGDVNSKHLVSKEIYGQNHRVEKLDENTYCLTSGQDCPISQKLVESSTKTSQNQKEKFEEEIAAGAY